MNMSRLFSDWEIRIVALGLAVMVYIFTGSLIEVDQSLTIRIDKENVTGLSEQFQVRDVSPRQLVIEIHGPRSAMEGFDAEDLMPQLAFDPDDLDAGVQTFDVTPRMLQLPAELRLRYTSIDQVRVAIDVMIRTVMPVVVELDDFVFENDHAVVRHWDLEHTHVEVVGPQDLIAKMRENGGIRVRKVQLAPDTEVITEPRDLSGVPLILDLPEGVTAENRLINAKVTVVPKPDQLQLSLPVQVLAPDDFLSRYTVELHQSEVAMTLRGPAQRLRTLDPARDLVAYVDLQGEPTLDLPHSRPVRIIAPQWVSAGSAQVRVTVRLKQGHSAAPSVLLDPADRRRLPDVEIP